MSLEADFERLRLENPQPPMSRLEEPERPVSRFEALPQELRYEILGYLLNASAVRHRRPRGMIRQTPTMCYKLQFFDWQVQILRVSSTFYHDGKYVLYQGNKWVKLQAELRQDHVMDVPLVVTNSAFEKNVKPLMEITLKIGRFRLHNPSKMTSFMLPVAEVASLCKYLREGRYSSNVVYTYDIVIPAKVVKSLQRRLLQPFAVLREDSVVQIVNIRGEVYESLANKVKASITQTIGWERGRLWDFYSCSEALFRAGNEAFLKQDFLLASARYKRFLGMSDRIVRYRPDLVMFDKDIAAAERAMFLSTHTNLLICQIHSRVHGDSEFFPPDAAAAIHLINCLVDNNTTPAWLSRKHAYVVSIGFLHDDNRSEAIKLLEYMIKRNPVADSALLVQTLDLTKRFRLMTSEDRQAQLSLKLDVLASQPTILPEIQSSVCDVAASEKYVCRQLGFTGRFNEGGTRVVRDGISICYWANGRAKVLGLFPKDSISDDDLNILEALLYERMYAESSRNLELAQIGHVLPATLAPIITHLKAMKPRLEDVKDPRDNTMVSREGLGTPVKWI